MAEAENKNSTRQLTSAVNDAQWRDIEKTLPAAADRASVRHRLEQIARAKSTPAQLAVQCEEIASSCGGLARALLKIGAEIDLTGLNPDDAALMEQLTRRGDAAKKQAAAYRQIGKVKRRHFLRQCELLWLWETIGGDLGISTPPKPQDKATWPPPHGPVIDYFQAAAKAVFGKTPAPGQIKEIVSQYRHLNFGTARLSGEGGMAVDNSEIFILREGKLLGPGEESLPENQPDVLRAERLRREQQQDGNA